MSVATRLSYLVTALGEGQAPSGADSAYAPKGFAAEASIVESRLSWRMEACPPAVVERLVRVVPALTASVPKASNGAGRASRALRVAAVP